VLENDSVMYTPYCPEIVNERLELAPLTAVRVSDNGSFKSLGISIYRISPLINAVGLFT
jgi:hypothetical protein